MKRLVIALVILSLLVGANIYTRIFLDRSGLEMMDQIENLEKMVGQCEAEELTKQCESMLQKWLKTEEMWCRFMRSDRLESITVAAARLPSLAKHEQTADIAAELCGIRIMLGEVLAFESPAISDIL